MSSRKLMKSKQKKENKSLSVFERALVVKPDKLYNYQLTKDQKYVFEQALVVKPNKLYNYQLTKDQKYDKILENIHLSLRALKKIEVTHCSEQLRIK